MSLLPLLLLVGAGAYAVSSSKKKKKKGKSKGSASSCPLPTILTDVTEEQRQAAMHAISTDAHKLILVNVLEDLGYDDDPSGIAQFQKDFNTWASYMNRFKGSKLLGLPADGKMNVPTILALVSFVLLRDQASSQNVGLEPYLDWKYGISFCGS